MNGDSNRSEASNTVTSVVSEAVVRSLSAVLAEIETQLHDLQIPVAETSPEELVDRIRRIVEAIVLERLIHLCLRSHATPRQSIALRAVHPRPAGRHPAQRSRINAIPISAARSTFMNKKRAAFQILFANAR